MASLTFYQNAVVGVQAKADVADFTLTSDDKLYYHFDCAPGNSAKWDEIFADVQYKTTDNKQNGMGGATEDDQQGGTLHRYEWHSGSPDFTQDDLISQVQLLVNFFMMNDQDQPASGNLDGDEVMQVGVIDEVGEDDQFLIGDETWAAMLLDTTGRITTNQLNLIIDHFGSKGRLAASSDGTNALVAANLRKPANQNAAADPATEIKVVITYEVRVIVIDEYASGNDRKMAKGAVPTDSGLGGGTIDPDIQEGQEGDAVSPGEEENMFSSKTFAFTKGASLNDPINEADATDLDASGAPKTGRVDCLRFRKTYHVESA